MWKPDFWTYTTRHVRRAGKMKRGVHQGEVITARPPASLAQVRSSLLRLASRGRLRNLLADCCNLGLYCVTITRQ